MRPLRPTLPKSMIDYAQQRQHLALLDDVLEEQGYHYREEDGRTGRAEVVAVGCAVITADPAATP